MTRGKHAVQASKRRLEATQSHVDHLTDQLVEAKLRARQHEKAAIRLPMIEEELARLRTQLETGTSDKVEAERHKYDDREAEIQAGHLELAAVLRKRVGEGKGYTADEYGVLRRVLGPEAFQLLVVGPDPSRNQRRIIASGPRVLTKTLKAAKEAEKASKG
jgi:hypothetical protein